MSLIAQITKEELEFCECFYDPICMTECCFSDLDNLLKFDEEMAEVRIGQFPMFAYEYLLDTEQPTLSKKDNFKLREGASSIYAFGGRRFGKTLIVEQVDILISMFLLEGEHVGFSSIDALHIRGIVEKIVTVLRTHKLFKVLDAQINRSPNYRISLPSGYLFESINMNLSGQAPGNSFFQKHLHRLYIEEAGFESEEVYNKRIDAVSEDGCVYRLAGMTNFTKYSPAGKAFFARENQSKVCNLPQTINPKWDEKEKYKAIREYAGESSAGYRVFVNGEVVEDGIAVMDMERVRKQYLQDKQLKTFEITKDNYKLFKEILVLERPLQANKVFVCADIGETAPTEIIILHEVNGLYYYTHEIVAYRLDDKQQFNLIRYVVDTLGANVVGLDSSIPPDEFVLARVDNSIKYVQIKNINKDSLIEVPTYNADKLEWKKAELTNHQYSGKIKEFIVDPGNYRVRVTDNHSMMIYDKDGLKEVMAADVKVGDYVITPKRFNLEENNYKKLKYKLKKVNDKVEDKFASVVVDEDLGSLLGWAVSEGCSKTAGYQFALGDEPIEAGMIEALLKKCFGVGIRLVKRTAEEHNSKNPKVRANFDRYTVVSHGGKGLLEFFESQVGKGCYNKRVPEVIFNSPKSVQLAFISACLAGDGHERKRFKATDYVFTTSSKELAAGLVTLCRMNDIYAGYSQRGEKLYRVGFSNAPLIGRWLGVPTRFFSNTISRKDKKVLSNYRLVGKKLETVSRLLGSDWCFHRVKEIRETEYSGTVYDFVVEDNHTFVAGIGNILVHNTDGTGRAIFRQLSEIYPAQNLVACSFTEKIAVGLDRDDKGRVIFEDGKPKMKEEYVSEWTVRRLKTLFYEGKLWVPSDHKLDLQLNSIVATVSANRTVYSVVCPEDHLFAAFRVFALAEWQMEFINAANARSKSRDKLGC